MDQRETGQGEPEQENRQNNLDSNGADAAAGLETLPASVDDRKVEKPPFYGSPQSLRLVELLDIAFKFGNHVDRLWNMFLVASVGVLTLIATTASTKVSEEPAYRAAVFAIYALFCVINFFNLFRMYEWLDAAVDDLKNVAKEFDGEAKLKIRLESARVPGGTWPMLALYFAITLLVLAGIIFLPLIGKLWRWPW